MYLHIITLIVYGLLGLQYDASSVDSEMVTMMTAAIQENFHMNILLLLPAVVVIIMAVCKCPSIPTLMVSTLVAVVLAMLVQGQTLSGILNILDSGFSIDTALPEFNRLVNRGGLQSMLWTAALGILGMLYGSIMEKTGLLEALLSKMDPLVKSTGGLVTAVVLTCTLLLMVLPLLIRTAQEALRTIPAGQREASFGLGAGKGRTALHVLLPAAFPGMLAGILLAVGRITGESAALLFTAGSTPSPPPQSTKSTL